jgi:hypothetical protein
MTPAEELGLGPKKTALILFTVVGCIAILFPKIFYPMIVGPPKDMSRLPPSKSSQFIFISEIYLLRANYYINLQIFRSKNDRRICEKLYILACKNVVAQYHRILQFQLSKDLAECHLQILNDE